MSKLIPTVRNWELQTFRESISEWARGVFKNKKTHGLAQDHSKSYEAISESLPENRIYVDLANLRG